MSDHFVQQLGPAVKRRLVAQREQVAEAHRRAKDDVHLLHYMHTIVHTQDGSEDEVEP